MDSKLHIEDYFATDYSSARQKFIQACTRRNSHIDSYINPVSGNNETELVTDVIRLGDSNTDKLLVLTSGVHGAELMCGSGCQTGLILEGSFNDLPNDVAVLIIHAINPWGAVNLRRNTEDNVDLCRNFIDFSSPLPVNPGYEEIHDYISSKEYIGPERDKVNKKIDQYIAEKGMASYLGAIMSGQYNYPSGMSYGGNKPVWSHNTLINILEEHGKSANHVCLVDYHSGLGPYGYGSIVCMQGGFELSRAQRWFGEWVTAPMSKIKTGNNKFHPAIGHTTEGYTQVLSHAEVTSVVLEFGTHDMGSNLKALHDDHWLVMHGDESNETGKRIKADMLSAHYPDDPEWRFAVWSRANQVIRQALNGLINEK